MGDLYFLPKFSTITMRYFWNREKWKIKKQPWVRRRLSYKSYNTLWWEVCSLASDSADSLCDSKDMLSHNVLSSLKIEDSAAVCGQAAQALAKWVWSFSSLLCRTRKKWATLGVCREEPPPQMRPGFESSLRHVLDVISWAAILLPWASMSLFYMTSLWLPLRNLPGPWQVQWGPPH